MSHHGGTRIRRRNEPRVSDRWRIANDRLAGVLSPAAMSRWWITPLDKLYGSTPIQWWEAGREKDVEKIISGYRDTAFS